jgi:hypothetical protein
MDGGRNGWMDEETGKWVDGRWMGWMNDGRNGGKTR